MAFPKTRPATHGGPDEDAVIERIDQLMRAACGSAPAGELWIGDDAAVVSAPNGPLVLATDAVVGGVHADLSLVGLDDLGWKALAVTLSDLAAMGAVALRALLTVCAPAGTDLERLCAGVAEASAHWRCPVVGGDLSTAPEVVVTVAVTGTVEGHRPAVSRSGARPGDQLFVSGPLGGSAAGLRLLRAGGVLDGTGQALARVHRRPEARIAEGTAARRGGAAAMMDLSDGLGLDLHRLASSSRVGVDLEAASIPVAAGATFEEALGGGEDYELMVATAEVGLLEEAFASAGLRAPVRIGVCTQEPGCRIDGHPLERLGWEHHLG